MGKTSECLFALAVLIGVAACGTDRQEAAPAGKVAEKPVTPTKVAVVAHDFRFEAPATFAGGLIEVSLRNLGQEPHFVDIGRIAPGRALAEAQAALTAPAPPPGAPPPSPGPAAFERVAGVPTVDPGVSRTVTLNLEAGEYVLFCRLPSPDGVRHAAKGMISGATVTDGADRDLPAATGTITATDFAYGALPAWTAGRNVVRLRNDGRQFHELNLVEIQAGKTVDDVLAWFSEPDGAPPMRSLGGASIGPGREATTALQLRRGSTYAFLCAVPDFLGDRVPHLFKGMVSAAFTPEG